MKAILISAVFLVVSCAVDESVETDSESSLATESQTLTVPKAPTTPTTPTSLRTYLATRPQLYPLGVKSAYTVAWVDPKDSRFFLAVGYDVVSNRNVFYVRGSITTDHSVLLTNIAAGLELNTRSNPLFKGHAMKGFIPKGCCPPPGPFPESQWRVAFAMQQLVAQ